MTAIFSLIGGTNQFIMSLILKNISYFPIDLSSIINLCVSFFGLPYQNILHSLPLPYYTLYWSFIFMDIIWIIFAGLMFCGISKKKPGLMVPFIGLVGLTNVVRTKVIIEKSRGGRFLWNRNCNLGWIWAVWPNFLPS